MKYKALLFGSIGTLIESSDIQRNSFNEAFKKQVLIGIGMNKITKFYLRNQVAQKELKILQKKITRMLMLQKYEIERQKFLVLILIKTSRN